MYYKKCEICGVRSGRSNNKKRIFMAKFPRDEERCRQWVKIVGNEDLAFVPIEKLIQLKFVCGQHFRLKDFQRKKTRLKSNAIPSQDLKKSPLPDHLLNGFPLRISEDNIPKISNVATTLSYRTDHNYLGNSMVCENARIYIQRFTAPSINLRHFDHDYCKVLSPATKESNNPELSVDTSAAVEVNNALPYEVNKEDKKLPQSTSVSPQVEKLLKKIKLLQKKNRVLTKKLKDIENIQSPILKSFIESAIRNRNKKSFGKRWNNLNKSVSVEIYKKSPSTYKYLSQMLPMPSVRTIQIMLDNMNKEPAINTTMLEHVKEAEHLTEKENI